MTLVWRPGYIGLDDPDAVTYITAVEAADAAAGQAGGLEDEVKLAIHNFIKGCKADGIWSAIKASCILAGARTLSGALVPLVGAAPTNVNFVSGDYNRETGLIGNGTNKYLNSNRSNNAQPQNNIHLSVYASSQATSGGDAYPFYIGAGYSQSGSTQLGRMINNGNLLTRNRSSGFDSSSSSSTGFLGTTRNNSSNYITRFASTNKTITATSQAPYNGDCFIFWSSGATATDYSNARISFYSIGEALDLALLDARVTTLINAIAAAIP